MKSLTIDTQVFPLGQRTYIMGILNVTPDSFSDGGKFDAVEGAVLHGLQMQNLGADIIDIGGESTRPTAEPVTIEEELRRVLPVVRALKKQSRLPLSIDTYKADVAAQAIACGASLINDVWGFQKDLNMAHVAAQYKVPAILMHNQMGTDYEGDIIEAMKHYFSRSIELAISAGVSYDRLILDPGIGFGKTFEQNIHVMRNLKAFKSFGLPLVLGTSRKSIINGILNVPPSERVNGTVATTVMAVECGYDMVRVHDIKENLEAAKVADVIYRGQF